MFLAVYNLTLTYDDNWLILLPNTTDMHTQ